MPIYNRRYFSSGARSALCVLLSCKFGSSAKVDVAAANVSSWFMIYETKGLSLEQVDELYSVVTVAWKSKCFRSKVVFADVDADAQRHMSLAEIGANQERKRSVQHEKNVPTTIGESS
jgi:hypothetical protein